MMISIQAHQHHHHARQHEHNSTEAIVRAWELRNVVSMSRSGSQPVQGQRLAEWKAVEVETEIPVHLEKTLEHWHRAAATVQHSAPSSSSSMLTSEVSAVTPQEVSYLSAAKKGKEEGDGEEDSHDTRYVAGLFFE